MRFKMYTKAELIAKPNAYGGPCLDCNGDNEPFMLTAKVWNSITTTKDNRAFICIKCCTNRLGRPLTIKDFSNAPINYGCFGFNVNDYLKDNS